VSDEYTTAFCPRCQTEARYKAYTTGRRPYCVDCTREYGRESAARARARARARLAAQAPVAAPAPAVPADEAERKLPEPPAPREVDPRRMTCAEFAEWVARDRADEDAMLSSRTGPYDWREHGAGFDGHHMLPEVMR